jgi:mannose-6-phosphate isomerase-like protein (cupin superfamily)
MGNPSKVLKSHAFHWAGVEPEAYKHKGGPFKDVTRHTLLGERPGEEALQFITRYFEVQPGGYSTLEVHQHPHAVVILRGTGQVVLGGEALEIAPFDCVYVAPETRHQFRATGAEPLGFLCVVDRMRDRPEVVG